VNDQLPEKFAPTGQVAEGGVGPIEIVPADEEAVAARLRDLAEIAKRLRGDGASEVRRGEAIVSQLILHATMQKLMKKLTEKPKMGVIPMVQLVYSLGYLLSKMTDSQRLLLEFEKLSSPEQMVPPKATDPSFPAGEIVSFSPTQPTNTNQGG
jgi:hypothetical protein